MPQDDFLAGTYVFNDEVMYEGIFSESTNPDVETLKIQDCYLYNADYQSTEKNDAFEIDLRFSIGILYDCRRKSSWLTETEFKEIPCEKKLILNKKKLSERVYDKNTKKYFVHHLKNVRFNTRILDENKVKLTVTATIEGIILTKYHHNFWICDDFNPRPPSKSENLDWKQVLESINIRDTVLMFETLLALVKRLCSERQDYTCKRMRITSHSNQPAKEPPNCETCTNATNCPNQENTCEELYNIIRKLNDELKEKDYIIDGLLKCL